jgi:hypothetical protein
MTASRIIAATCDAIREGPYGDRPCTASTAIHVPARGRSKSMRVVRTAATFVTVALVAAFTIAAPAYAADSNARLKSRTDGRCAAVSYLNGTLIRPDCSYSQTRWHYQPRSTSPSGHKLVKFQSIYNNGCMDTGGAGSGGDVVSIACNTGNNQLWEEFVVGSYYVYKSWGAWTNRGQHLCLYAHPSYEEHLITCDTSVYSQQWARPAA